MIKSRYKKVLNSSLVTGGLAISVLTGYYIALALTAFGINGIFSDRWKEARKSWVNYINIAIAAIAIVFFLTNAWMPLGAQNSLFVNFLFVIFIVGVVLGLLSSVVIFYPKLLNWALNNKWKFLLSLYS